MIEMRKVFTTDPKSVFSLLSFPGLGYYIPPYQRPYSWGKENTLRIIEDVVHGLSMMSKGSVDAITFLGTLILLHDELYGTVEPQVKGDMPTRVMPVIDGQQRIVTLLLLNAALHNELSVRIAALGKRGAEKDFGLEWVRQRALQTRGDLGMTLFQDMNYGDGEYQYYPRIIRAYEDSWSRKAEKAKYASPIASFLHAYGSHARNAEGTKAFQMSVSSLVGGHRALAENWRTVRGQLRVLADGKLEDMPEPHAIGEAAEQGMFQQPLPDEVRELMAPRGEDSKERVVGRQLLRLVLFSRYLLERAAVTEVVAKDDDYAFDIFEALNTTGEPLTAFDTFKPRVIKAEGQAGYEASRSYHLMAVVERYLESYKGASEKHDATSRVLIPFALAETGVRLSKRLSEQRVYLRDSYDSLPTLDEKRGMLASLAETTVFLISAWPDDIQDLVSLADVELNATSEHRQALMCIDVLRTARHVVTQGLLVRFFAQARRAPAELQGAMVDEFAAVARAVTAFLALWRGPKVSTGNIDQQYRLLMGRGIGGVAPFARRSKGGAASSDLVTAVDVCTALRAALRDPEQGDVADKAEWVRRTAQQPLLQAEVVAKLILHAADDFCPGSAGVGTPVVGDMLSTEVWRGVALGTVAPARHVLPWERALYDDSHEQRLGNLVLVPVVDASAAHVVDGWTSERVEARSVQLAECAWNRLAPWLGISGDVV